MKVYKYIVIISILLFSNICNAKADSCDSDEMMYLKEISKEVQITYEYLDNNFDSNGNKIYDKFNLVIDGIVEDIYVKYIGKDIIYNYNNSTDGYYVINDFTSGKYTFEIRSSKCGVALKKVNLVIPKYNRYADDERCKGVDVSDVEYCDKWYNGTFSEEVFERALLNYNDQDYSDDDIYSLLNEYYLYIIIIIALILILIIVFIFVRNKRRRRLE